MANQLPPIKDLLKRSWEIYRARFWVLVGIMAIPTVVATFLIAGLGFLLLGFIAALMTAFITDLQFSPFAPLVLVFVVVLIPVALFLGFWPEIALLYAIKERKQEIGIKESFRKAWPKLISFIVVSFLIGLSVLAGLIFLIIPGIIFWVWFSLATFVLVVEDVKGGEALVRSKELVRGNWWPTFFRFLVIGVIGAVVSVVLNIIPGLGQLLSIILVPPFVAIFGFLVYEDLKRLAEEPV